MSSRACDLGIIGGGWTGRFAALLAAWSGHRVLLLEPWLDPDLFPRPLPPADAPGWQVFLELAAARGLDFGPLRPYPAPVDVSAGPVASVGPAALAVRLDESGWTATGGAADAGGQVPEAGGAVLWETLGEALDRAGTQRALCAWPPAFKSGWIRRARMIGADAAADLPLVRRWWVLLPDPGQRLLHARWSPAWPLAGCAPAGAWLADARMAAAVAVGPVLLPAETAGSPEAEAWSPALPWGVVSRRGLRVSPVPSAARIRPGDWWRTLLGELAGQGLTPADFGKIARLRYSV